MAEIKSESVADFVPESVADLLRNQQELPGGTAYRFNVYHIMEVEALPPLFPLEIEDL
jgi:hypothetical protein